MIEKTKNLNLKKEKIKKIEYLGKKQTYDFCIPKTHCFFANNILVHNSGSLEQTSHVVLLIYKYLDEKGMHYVLNIAKNRHGETGKREVRFEGSQFRFYEEDRIPSKRIVERGFTD